MFTNVIHLGAMVISTVFINRVPDQRFSCRCSRLDDTLKGNGVPVKAKISGSVSCINLWDCSYDTNPLVNSGSSLMILP